MSPKISEKLPHDTRLKLRVLDSGKMSPVIVQAAENGCLSQGTFDDLASDQGIPLACTTSPVVLFTPYTPERNVKYHVPSRPRRLKRILDPNQNGRFTVRFEGGEHTAIGDSALLYFSASDPGTPAYQVQLHLPNGLSLTYGQIVSLGGDFYGIPDSPISDGSTQADRMNRFTNAYNTLATASGAVSEAPQILQVMQTEINAVNQALDNGQPASAAYQALGDTLSARWNRITGGGSFFSDWYPLGRYLKLAAVNWDHFAQHAVLAYQTGHAVALQFALAARSAPPTQQKQSLVWAYAMNAFADHFLSDLFSGGHIRTPRKEMYDHVTPSDVGSLLSRYMHDEDSLWGLNVTNQGPPSSAWRAYGDKRYFDTVDVANKNLVDYAVQRSVDELFGVFTSGNVPPPEDYVALLYIADLTAAQNSSGAQAAGNVSPFFVAANDTVQLRNDINNLNDYTWTDSWWGWSTLAKIKKDYAPNPPQQFPQPPSSAPAISPDGWSYENVAPDWMPDAQVRYAVSFITNLYESDLGPWCAYVTVGPNHSFPTVTNIPVGPAGTIARRIYREFVNSAYTYLIQIWDNVTTTFKDDNDNYI